MTSNFIKEKLKNLSVSKRSTKANLAMAANFYEVFTVTKKTEKTFSDAVLSISMKYLTKLDFVNIELSWQDYPHEVQDQVAE